MEQDPQTLTPEPVLETRPEGVEGWQTPPPEPKPFEALRWILIGDKGLRAGWSMAVFIGLLVLFARAIGFVLVRSHLAGKGTVGFTVKSQFIGEFAVFLAMVGAGAIVALIEQRRILDYNLSGPTRLRNFCAGLATGFGALSVLVGALAAGGWLHFGSISLSGAHILTYALAWGAVFLLVGFVEEGTMRCYFQFTLTRGLNFWLAAGIVGAICLDLILRAKGNGAWGVYAIALLGVVPCLLLQLKKAPSSGFWQAAWVTSTFFGFAHTGNNGENWIGIFTAAFIGFVFCVSVRLTGSAWWAIGCHTAWDWAETYFYGTADSGLVAKGHYLSTSPAGNPLWSGAADGPEGSLLVLPVTILLLLFIMMIYGRKRSKRLPVVATEPLPS
jgi:uncharacterized protein